MSNQNHDDQVHVDHDDFLLIEHHSIERLVCEIRCTWYFDVNSKYTYHKYCKKTTYFSHAINLLYLELTILLLVIIHSHRAV